MMVGLNIEKELFCIQYGGRHLYPNLQRCMRFSSKDSEGNGRAGRLFRCTIILHAMYTEKETIASVILIYTT